MNLASGVGIGGNDVTGKNINEERNSPGGLHTFCIQSHHDEGGLAGIRKAGLIEEGIAQAI